jgi:hypothetical protein
VRGRKRGSLDGTWRETVTAENFDRVDEDTVNQLDASAKFGVVQFGVVRRG